MKIKLFLILLTTFTSVALSLIPNQKKIRLINTNLYWALNDTNLVLKTPEQVPEVQLWTIIPYAYGSYFLAVGHPGLYVQFNQPVGEQLSATEHEEGYNHRWLFTEDNPVTISSSQDPSVFIIANDSKVVAGYDCQPQWILE
uniref:Zinc finger protein 589 n=1 Tax=Anthurium amnicola TaxID=1678845 RepID=A0A1D1ZJN9_9ARAE